MRSVSSRVILPELPDARMETRRPIDFLRREKKLISESSQSALAASMRERNFAHEKSQQERRARSRVKPLRGPRTVAEICSGRKKSWARDWTSSRVTASMEARISSSE